MVLISGILLMVLAAVAFVYSLPRGGKTAWFVGAEWEGYVVVSMIGSLGVGAMLVFAGTAQLLK
jgi:hypothetical protein